MMDEQHNRSAADAVASPVTEAGTASPNPGENDTLEIVLEDVETPAPAADDATEVLVEAGDQVTEALAARSEQVAEALAAQSGQAAEVPAGGTTTPAPEADSPADDTDLVIELDEDKPAPEPAPAAAETGTIELSKEDVLEVNLDAEEEAMPPLAGKPADLDLSAMDLDSDPAPIASKAPAWGEPVGESLPGKATGESLPGKEVPVGKSVPTTAVFSFSGVFVMAVAGLLGGLLGWALTEPLQGVRLLSDVMDVALYAALAGGAIGLALGAGSGFSVGVSSKAARWAGFGLLSGALGGILGGGLAQSVYGALATDYTFAAWAQLLMRAAGWSIMGMFFGLGQSAVVVADKKMRNGILGGALGGLLGGAVFQWLVASAHGSGGRCLALCAMGLCIGALIGLVEEVAKEAWVRVIRGPLTGKQFVLYEERTVIGGSPTCSIMLIKDPNVAPEHAVIRNNRTEFVIAALFPGAVVLVNDRPVSQRVLEDGDSITIGMTRMEFRERKKDEEQKAGKKMWGRVK